MSPAHAGTVSSGLLDATGASTWGVFTSTSDPAYGAYAVANPINQLLYGKIALQPRARWFTSVTPASVVAQKIRDYIDVSQHGDPDAVVQLATFRLWPHGEAHKLDPLSQADRAAYRRWVDNAAQGIGSSPVAVVVEPDLAVAIHGWRPAVRYALAKYAVEVFSSLPNTDVYLDAADAEWLKVSDNLAVLKKSGISMARGFALGATHNTSTPRAIRYGSSLVAALATAGIPRKHFVVDTSDNGRPFSGHWWHRTHPGQLMSNARACTSLVDSRCVTLGIPPTSDVTNARWGLPSTVISRAQQNVDAYIWIGRPWLYRMATPFLPARALLLAASTPY